MQSYRERDFYSGNYEDLFVAANRGLGVHSSVRIRILDDQMKNF